MTTTLIIIAGLWLGLCLTFTALYLIACKEVSREMEREQRRAREQQERIRSADSILSKVFMFSLVMLLLSCNSAKHYQRVHGLQQSGTYTIKTYGNNTATFKEFPGRYVVPSDTLKPGDKIFITVVRPVRKQTHLSRLKQ